MSMMKRVVKLDGFASIDIEEVPVPEIGEDEILVRLHRTLISRGSELFARYNQPHAVDPSRMGYSAAGVVEKVGSEVPDVAVGDRVSVVCPHAEYGIGKYRWRGMAPNYVKLPETISFEQATFLPLCRSSVGWARSCGAKPGDTVAILGMGLVGLLCLQNLEIEFMPRTIAVDALELRCELAKTYGADHVVNCSEEDSVEAVRSLTDGKGADIVLECVGGDAGTKSFAQAQQMLAGNGTLHLISLYQGGPLPLDSSRMMGKQLIAGFRGISPDLSGLVADAVGRMAIGEVRVDEMITHRFRGEQAKDAFDFLYEHPEQAVGVIFEWA